MAVPWEALAVFAGAAALAVVRWPSVVVFLPLALHAAYLLQSCVPLGSFCLPTTGLEVLVVLAVTAALARDPRRVIRAARALPRSVRVCLTLFVVAATLSATIAPHPRTAWGHWKAFIMEPLAYALVLLPLLRSPDGQKAVVRALLAGGVLAAGLSLLAGVFTPDFSRLQGIYDVPNSLALVLAPLAAFAATLAASEVRTPLRTFAFGSLLVSVPVLLLTQSAAGLAAAVLGSAVGAWQSPKALQHTVARGRRWKRTVAVFSVIVITGVSMQWATGKLTHALSSISPLTARLRIWQVSFILIRDHPVLGTGLGTFEPAYQQKLHEVLRAGSRGQRAGRVPGDQDPGPHAPVPLEWLVRDPHNALLSFWLNTGLLGLLSMSGLVFFALRRPSLLPLSPYTLAAQAALAAALLFGLVDVPYLKNDLALLWWVYVMSGTLPLLAYPHPDRVAAAEA